MAYWIESGRLLDAILVLTALEWLALRVHHAKTGRGIDTRDVTRNLVSGVCLLAGLRAALAGASWIWIALALTGALVAHLADLRRRWIS